MMTLYIMSIFENGYISNEINSTFTFIELKVHEIKLKVQIKMVFHLKRKI